MNGRRILTTLIRGFVVLNIALLILNGIKFFSAYRLSAERVEDIIAILNEQGIQVECELPRVYIPRMEAILTLQTGANTSTTNRYDIAKTIFGKSMSNVVITNATIGGEYNQRTARTYSRDGESLIFDQEEIVYLNENEIKAKEQMTVKKAKQLCQQFIDQIKYKDLFKDAYVQVKDKGEYTSLIYYPKFDGIPVFSNYIKFELVNNKIYMAKIRVGYIESTNKIRENIYPIDLVLFGIKDELEKRDVNMDETVYITDITLGYESIDVRNATIFGEQLIPVYKIIIKGLDLPILVNAYTNIGIE